MTGKLLGAALIVAAALWAFTAQLRTRKRQTQLLQELAAALDTMAAAIRWQRMAMPDILASLKRYPLAGPYFQKIEKQLRQGIPLQEAWHRMFSTLAVGGELLTALELTGDEEKLTAALLYTARQLKDCCQRRRQEQRQGTKLWLAGALSGAGLLIILLM